MNSPGSGTGRQFGAVFVVLLVVSGTVGIGVTIGSQPVAAADAAGNVEGTPHLNTSAPNARFDPGQSGTIDVTLSNNATYDYGGDDPPEGAVERAGEAQSVSVNITDTNVSGEDAPLTVETGEQSAGTIADGESAGPYPFNVVVDEDADAGTYKLEVTAEYVHYRTVNYTQDSDGDYVYTPKNRTSRTETDTITVVIEPEANFEVADTTPNVPLGGEGTVSVVINNTGDENGTEATVSLTSQDSDFYFGSGTATTEQNIGVWQAGEEQTVTVRAGTVESAVEREYPIDVTVEYTDSDGATASDSTQIGIMPGKRDHFAVTGVAHDVPENGEGTLEVSVQQVWKQELTDVAVTATTTATDVYLGSEGSRSSTTYVEEWPGGNFDWIERLTFRVGTTDAAVDRTYPIELQFEYTDEADNQNTQTKYVDFSPTERSFFEVESVNHDIPRNGEGTLSVELEQTGEKEFEAAQITASTADSAVYLGDQGSASATTMVGDWDDDDDETVTFRVGTTAGAVEQPYPLDLTIEYTDAEDNENSRTKTVEFTPAAVDHLELGPVTHNVPQDGVGPVTIELTNSAEKTLTELSVTASSTDSEIYVGSESSRSGSATIEELAPDESRNVTYHVGATANAVNRTYPLDLSIDYTDADNNENQQEEQIEFRPRPEPQFLIESVDHDVPVGSTGRVAITLRNTGPVNATETVVTATSESDSMFFGTGGTEPVEFQGVAVEPPQTGTPTAQSYVGNWSTGETRTVSFRAGFDQDAIVRDYVTNLAISYENEAGDEMPERTRAIGLEPFPEQTFSISPVGSDLYVGEEGDLLVNVTNTADRAVDGVVVTAETQAQNINFYNARYAVADLGAGESAVSQFRVGITEEAEPGPRVFELSARYRDPQGNIRRTDSRDVIANVEPRRDAFDLEVANETFSPGESGPFQVTVTNNRNETLRNIQAKFFTDDPLDSEDDSAFIEDLGPGESATVTLDLSVSGAAREKTYSASMDFRFDNARGDSELTDTQRVPVEVRESNSMLSPLLGVLLGIGIVALVIVGWRFDVGDRIRETYRKVLGP
jgi:hypothetical protein